MRSSSLLLASILIFAIQFVSVHTQNTTDPFVGRWTNPFVYDMSDIVCCVPNSITISKTVYGYTAEYEYSSSFTSGFSGKCTSLFSFSGRGTLQLYPNGYGVYQASRPYLSGFQSAYFNFQVTGNNSLSIQYPGSSSAYSYNGCRFTMNVKETSSNATGGAVFILIIIIIFAFVAFKNHQRKQLNLLAQQNAAARDAVNPQPNPLDAYQFSPAQTNVYVAPNMHVAFNPNQQFVQAYPQQQVYVQQTQAFPQQTQAFPQANAQMNMNFGAPGHVNMAVNVNGEQPRF